ANQDAVAGILPVSTLEPQWRFKQETEVTVGAVAKQPKHSEYAAGSNRVQLKISSGLRFHTAINGAVITSRLIAAFAGKDILVA
ncbi:hypothetical protein, partial [Escherichia coli]|uniref:hypothetical protein n=1 Tax=Escherichia coli TaxID=562 RepID=UPI001BE9F8F8